jgi:hypothetical protein
MTGKPVSAVMARASSSPSIGRHACRGCRPARGHLVAHQPDGLGARSDEDQAGIAHRLREGRVLGKEAVAGMDGVGAALAGGFQNALDVEIGLGRVRRADIDCLVGQLDGKRFRVGVAIGLDGAYAERAGGADDAHRDLAAIGDQQRGDRHAALCLDVGQRIAGHDRLLVVDVEAHDLSRDLGLHLVEGLHHLDQADHVASRDGVSLFLEDRLVR